MSESDPKLSPGKGFHLEGDGKWDIQEIPDWVLDQAEFTGYLTIHGYNSSVFETQDGDQWAQKSSGTPAPKGDQAQKEMLASIAKRITKYKS